MNMYIGSHTLMKRYDECLLKHGHTIEQLVDKASDCLLKHIHGESFSIVCGPGNNGADGLSPVSYTHLDVYKRQGWRFA